jgi:DNA-binding Lrp family transcriptional regulator
LTIAYVLVNSDVKQEEKVKEELLQLDEVKEAYMVYGTYDVVVKIEVEDLEKLRNVVTNGIRIAENIQSTSTLIVTRGLEWDKI